MSRLRYPFTEISARCRLCGATGFTASSEHALGGRLIDWRREHARVCSEWPAWAEKKGLRIDENGALLYPNEDGPYEPRVRPKGGDEEEGEPEDTTNGQTRRRHAIAEPKIDLMQVPADQLEQSSFF